VVLAALLGLWSLAPLVVLLVHVGGGEAVGIHTAGFNGADGLQVDDQLQYLAWARDAGEHVLIANPFDIKPDPHLFLDPALALSGLAWRLGLSLQLAYLLWKPLAVALLFWGFAAYVRRLVGPDRWLRFAALALALFYFTPATALADWLGGGPNLRFGTEVMGLETFTAGFPWGGYSATLAVAGMPLFLLGVERVLDPARRAPGRSARCYAIGAGLAGMATSWLHPWQGITLLVMVAGLVVWGRLDRRYLALARVRRETSARFGCPDRGCQTSHSSAAIAELWRASRVAAGAARRVPEPAVVDLRALTLPVALAAAPLAYFAVLSRTRSSWGLSSHVVDYSHLGPWFWAGTGPLALALAGWLRRPGADVQERLLRLWPVAALLVYFGLHRTWFYHALVGLSLPCAVLAVRGFGALARSWARPRVLLRAAGVAVALALTVPGMVWATTELDRTRNAHFVGADEARALGYLDRLRRPGAVLAAQPLGLMVPAFTGRRTWVGHYNWTPDYRARVGQAAALFGGRLGTADATRLVGGSGATFLIARCVDHADLGRLLAASVVSVRRFGCAAVYELRGRPTTR
jgi:hypothetical protein